MTDIYTAQTDNHQDRTDAIRKLRESMQVSLRAELAEKLAFLKHPIVPSGDTERDATAEEINQATAQAVNLYEEIDSNEAFLKSWTPPPPVNLPTITDEHPLQPNWLIENWLPRNELTVFSGIGGTGKSHIMLNLAIAASCGCPEAYLNTQGTANPDRTERTMFASWEDTHASVQRRTKRVKEKFAGWFDKDSVASNVIYRDMKPQGQIWVPASETGHIANRGMMSNAGHELLDSCIRERISMLILDSIAAVFGQDLNSAAHVRPFLNYLSAWSNEHEVTIILIGHPNKTGQGGVSGSVDWHNGVRSRWELDEIKKDKDEKDIEPYYALIHAKANDAPTMPNIPLIRNTNGIYEQATGPSLEQKVKKAQKEHKEYHEHWQNYTPSTEEENTHDESEQEDTHDDDENPYANAFK